MVTSKRLREQLLDQRQAKERTLAHLRMRLNQAASNAPRSLVEEIEKVEREINRLDTLLTGRDVPQEDPIQSKKGKRRNWLAIASVTAITLTLLVFAIGLDWISGVQGIILAIVPPLIFWLVSRIFEKN